VARRTPEEAEQTKQALLSIALQQYATVGIYGTSLKAIAAEAGVTHGALYWHFASRDDLIVALCGSQSLPIERFYLDQLQAIDQNALEALGKFLVDSVLFISNDQRAQQIYRLFYSRRSELPQNEQLQALLTDQWELWEGYVNKFLKQARKQKLIPKKTKNLPIASMLLSHVFGLLEVTSYLPQPVGLKKLAELSVSSTLKGLETLD
jgi:AcrR family transcriptional regulator